MVGPTATRRCHGNSGLGRLHSWLPIYHPWLVTTQTSLWWMWPAHVERFNSPRRTERCFSCVFIFLGVEEGTEIDRVRSSSKGMSLTVLRSSMPFWFEYKGTEQNAQKTGDFGLESRDLCHRRWAKRQHRLGCLRAVWVTLAGYPKRSFRFLSNILHKYPNFWPIPLFESHPYWLFQSISDPLVSMSSIPTIRGSENSLNISLYKPNVQSFSCP